MDNDEKEYTLYKDYIELSPCTYLVRKPTNSSLSEHWCKIKFEKKMQGISQQDMKKIDTIIYIYI